MIRTFLPAAIAGVLTALIVNALTVYAPEWEGSIWPVAVTHKVSYVTDSQTSVLVEGDATKVRDCELVGTSIYVTDPSGNRTLADLEAIGPIRLRPLGQYFHWGPWRVDIPILRTKIDIEAVTTHRCHPFWVTRSKFWEMEITAIQ